MNPSEFERFYRKIVNRHISYYSTMLDFECNYQEPEVDEQGTYYGYKILHKHCTSPRCPILFSPRFIAVWKNGELTANEVPSEHTTFGIYFTKRPDHPELNQYCRFYPEGKWVLVRCALSGTIIETEQGFRAEHAQIEGVCRYGYWQSYQDYQERAQAYSDFAPQEKYWKADWDSYP